MLRSAAQSLALPGLASYGDPGDDCGLDSVNLSAAPPTSGAPAIELVGVTKRYGEVLAVSRGDADGVTTVFRPVRRLVVGHVGGHLRDQGAKEGVIAVNAFRKSITGFTTNNVVTQPFGYLAQYGITFDTLKTSRFADIGSMTRPMRADERAMIEQEIEHVYDVFTGRVAEGRRMSKAGVDSIGQGRVWTGTAAVNIGLAKVGSGITLVAPRTGAR